MLHRLQWLFAILILPLSLITYSCSGPIGAFEPAGNEQGPMFAPPGALPKSVTLNPTSVTSGFGATGTVTMTKKVSANTTVALSSANPGLVSVPASVVVLKGQTSATFPISTVQSVSENTVALSATSGGVTVSASLLVLAVPLGLDSISLSLGTVTGGTPLTLAIFLNGVTSDDFFVQIFSSEHTVATVVNGGAEVLAGNISGSSQVITYPVSAPISVVFTGMSATKTVTATLLVTP